MGTFLDRVQMPHRGDVEYALGHDGRAMDFGGELHLLKASPDLISGDLSNGYILRSGTHSGRKR